MNIQDMMNPKPEDKELQEAIKSKHEEEELQKAIKSKHEEEELQAAIKRGYLIVTSRRPAPDDLVRKAIAELNPNFINRNNIWGCYVEGRGENCEQLFEEGFDVSYYSNRRLSG
jgi:hypothetical protein